MPVLARQGCQSSRVSIAWQTKSEMPPSQEEESRLNLLALRTQMVKRIGSERANQYFAHFRSFISSKLSKQELDSLVVLIIGKENISLHNQIIKAVLNNAIKCSRPPPVNEAPESVKGVGKKSREPCDTAMAILPASHAAANNLVRSNGKLPFRKDGEPATPDRKAKKDKASLHGPSPGDGKSVGCVDLHRPSYDAAQNAADQLEADASRLNKRARTMWLPLALETSTHDTKARQFQLKDSYHHRWNHGLSRALFSSLSPRSIRPASQQLNIGLAGLYQCLLENGGEEVVADTEELPDTETLHGRMVHLAALEGIEAVSSISAELLNRGVDAFVRRLIKSCMDVVTSRGAQDRTVPNCSTSKRLMDGHDVSGARQAEGSGSRIANALQESPCGNSKTRVLVLPDEEKAVQERASLLDFKAAMELNPQQLGEDWPLQLENITFYSPK